MPTYEYVCRACGLEFERFQPITSEAIRKCPKCGKRKVERKIGIGAGVLFKGGGFYETDYRSESYKKQHESETKAAEPKSDAKPDAKTDSKSDVKADAKVAAPETRSGDSKVPAKTEAPKESPTKSSSGATHPSRVGRGAGNFVQRPPKPKAKKPPRRKS